MTQVTSVEVVDVAQRRDGFDLDDQLCFALYAATHAITRNYRSVLAEVGLTYPQYLVMLVLWQDGPSTVGDVAGRLQLDSHAVSPLLDRLAVAGLVARRRGVDRRRIVVELTTPGRDLEDAVSQIHDRVVCNTGLDPADLADLRSRLHGLTERLSQHDRSAPSPVPKPHIPQGEAS